MKQTQKKQQTHNNQHAEGTYFSYTLGFTFSIIATLIPYLLLEYHIVGGKLFVIVAVASALIQLLVQLVLFLHLSFRHRSMLNLIIFIYTIMMVGIVVAGTLWIMYNLNANMMDNVFPDGVFTPQSAAY